VAEPLDVVAAGEADAEPGAFLREPVSLGGEFFAGEALRHEEHAAAVKDSPVNGTSAPVFRLMSDS